MLPHSLFDAEIGNNQQLYRVIPYYDAAHYNTVRDIMWSSAASQPSRWPIVDLS